MGYLDQRIEEIKEHYERFGKIAQALREDDRLELARVSKPDVSRPDFVDLTSLFDRDYAAWTTELEVPEPLRERAVKLLAMSYELVFDYFPSLKVEQMLLKREEFSDFFSACQQVEKQFHDILVDYRTKLQQQAQEYSSIV